jgi:hypothetical protein
MGIKRKRERVRRFDMKLDEIDSKFAIQVDGKHASTVMIFADSVGRKIVEDLWPDIRWSTDDKFSRWHSADWLFTHIKVTRLPPHLEVAVPLAFASAESLGYAVALALHDRAWPLQVAWWSGEGANIQVNTMGAAASRGP